MNYVYLASGITLPLAFLLYYYLTKNYRYWEKKGVPCLNGAIPGIGNVSELLFMRKNVFQTWQDIYNKMPGRSVVGFYFARNPALLIRDPELVKAVLQTDFTNFSSNGNRFNPKTDHLLNRNPLVLNGEDWKFARKQLSSATTAGKLKYMYQSIDMVCQSFRNYLDDKVTKGNGKVELELKTIFSKFTAEAVSSAAFGFQGNSFTDDHDGTFVKLGKMVFEPSFNKAFNLLSCLFVPFIAQLFNAGLIPREMTNTFKMIVNDMLKYRSENNVERNDFLQLMINLKNSGASDHIVGGQFNDDTITAHSASFFMEGYETSSITLAFFGYQLASHADVQKRVREDILTAVDKHGGITYDALQEMTYMDQALNESIRLYSAVGFLFKICTGETELVGSDGIKCKVEPGTPVMIPIRALHMDPQYWPEPHKFDPERFNEESKQSRHKFTYIPFGRGPRVCLGARLAMLQVKAAMATMLSNYRLELSARTQVPIKLNPYHFLASPVGGLWVELEPL